MSKRRGIIYGTPAVLRQMWADTNGRLFLIGLILSVALPWAMWRLDAVVWGVGNVISSSNVRPAFEAGAIVLGVVTVLGALVGVFLIIFSSLCAAVEQLQRESDSGRATSSDPTDHP